MPWISRYNNRNTPVSGPSLTYPDTVQYFQYNLVRKVEIERLEFTHPQASVILLGKETVILSQKTEILLIGNHKPKKEKEETTTDLLKEYNGSFK